MELTIQNFRCWRSLTLSFEVGKLTLLSGNSGAGKTTVLNAIEWCFYGKGSSDSIAPFEDTKCWTAVQVKFRDDNLTIYRDVRYNGSTAYRNIRVSTDQGYIQGEAAQRYIESLFGGPDLWVISCYLQQKQFNRFDSLSNKEKMQILHELAFRDDNPIADMMKIDNEILRVNTLYKELERRYADANAYLQGQIQALGITQNDFQTPQQLTLLEQEQTALQQELITLQQKQQERQIALGKLENYRNLLQDSERTRNNCVLLPMEITEPLSELEEEAQRLMQISELEKKIAEKTIVGSLENFLTNGEFNEQDLITTSNIESAYHRSANICRAISMPYDKKYVEEELQNLRALLDEQPLLKRRNQYQQLLMGLQIHKESDPPVVPEQPILETIPPLVQTEKQQLIQELENRLRILQKQLEEKNHLTFRHQQSLKTLRCPKCTSGLRFVNNTLMSFEEVVPDQEEINRTQEEIRILQIDINNITTDIQMKRLSLQEDFFEHHRRVSDNQKAYQKKMSEYQKAVQELEKWKSGNQERERIQKALQDFTPQEISQFPTGARPVYNDLQLEDHRRTIHNLSQVQFIELPSPSSQEIRRHLEFIKANQEKKILEQQRDGIIRKFSYNYQELISRIQKIKQITNHNLQVQSQISTLETTINHLKSELAKIVIEDSQTVRINEITTRIQEIDTLRKRSQNYNHAMTLSQQNQEISREGMRIYEDLKNLNNFRQLSKDIECQTLQNMVDNLNITIAEVLNRIFTSPIVVNLNLKRTMKSSKEIKQSVHFGILYRSGEMNTIRALSGGEADRTSVGFTIGMNLRSDCKLFMIDETLLSLDTETRIATLKTIKELLPHKILIIVSHDMQKGLYDQTYDF